MKQSKRLRTPKIRVYPRTREPVRDLTCIDLFSGAGGLAEGFRQAGWSILAANDLDEDAAATFRLNFPEAVFLEGSINAISPDELLLEADLVRGQLDCLIGGPPCQSFSYNNHQRSASDVRARLFRKYLALVEAVRPKTLVMENVPGMLTIAGGRVLDEIKRALRRLGYSSEVKILFAEDFGVPQTRRRAFVLATRLSENASNLFPAGTHGPSEKPSVEANPFAHRWEPVGAQTAEAFVTVWDAIGDLREIVHTGSNEERPYRSPPSTEYQRSMRTNSQGLWNHVCHALSDKMLERIAHVPEGGNWRDIPFALLPAGMQRARESDHTKRYGRLRRRGLASTILTKCDPHWGAYVHPTQDRTISVREAARLQGFPDRFHFAGTYISKHYEQVGNAVPVPVARALGVALAQHVSAAKGGAPGEKAVASAA